jgi:drug/metabolite transporter (DMT)-like permease
MSIGVGVLLFVIGAIFAFALDVDPPGVEGQTLGYILMLAGLLVGVLSFAFAQRAGRREVVREAPAAPRERVVERRTERDEPL